MRIASEGLRVAVVGATGALGTEVLGVLRERRFPIRDLLPIATDRSLGCEIEMAGESIPVETEPPDLDEVDLLFLCAPVGASLQYVRSALRARVSTVDLSGALCGSEEVPLAVVDLGTSPEALSAPVVATPAGASLAWALALAPLDRAAGLQRVVGTSLEAVSGGGLRGIDSLHTETVALLTQQDLPAPTVFAQPVAFDCVPAVGRLTAEGETLPELAIGRDLARLLGRALPVGASAVRVPTFIGDGSMLAVETERALEPAEASALLAKAPGVEVWRESDATPTTRATAGRETVLVGRLRRDPSCAHGLLLWAAADRPRLAAGNAVRLAEARLRAN